MKKIIYNSCFGGFNYSEEFENWVEENYPDVSWERDSQELIALVESYGIEKASGNCCNLEIVEIDDACDFTIEEYDGYETVLPHLRVSAKELREGLTEEAIALLTTGKADFIVCE